MLLLQQKYHTYRYVKSIFVLKTSGCNSFNGLPVKMLQFQDQKQLIMIIVIIIAIIITIIVIKFMILGKIYFGPNGAFPESF